MRTQLPVYATCEPVCERLYMPHLTAQPIKQKLLLAQVLLRNYHMK